MAESRREGAQASKPSEWRGDDHRVGLEGDRNRGRASQAAQPQAERLSEIGREGLQQATDTSMMAANGVARSSSAVADCAQEIITAWSRYAEEVMRRSSEASRALLRSRDFNEILEVQSQLLRDYMQAFLDQSLKVAEAASRMTSRPLETMSQTASDKVRR
jgi:hypothetical protein